MQMVGRRVLATAFSLALLALLFAGGGGRAATDPTATVVVLTSGVVPEAEVLGSGDYGYADYGLVLRNRSLARDALDVTVEVEAVDGGGQSITDSYTTVTLIPAGADFVISGALIWRGSSELADIETEVACRTNRAAASKTAAGQTCIGDEFRTRHWVVYQPVQEAVTDKCDDLRCCSRQPRANRVDRLRPHRRSHSSRRDRGV